MKKRIGIVGGGQLGRMLAFDAKKLGFFVTVIDATPNSPAGQIADAQIIADVKDEKAIQQLAKKSDFLTFEVELANAEILEKVAASGVLVNPSAQTLSIIKDKLSQKDFLQKAHIPVAEFVEIPFRHSGEQSDSRISSGRKEMLDAASMTEKRILINDIKTIAKKFGYPLLLKARFDAYDGRGNALIKNKKGIAVGVEKLSGRKLYVERFVPFVKELAIQIARNTKGEIATYPVVETVHKNNICHTVFVPADVNEKVQKKTRDLAIRVMEHLGGAGVFAIEMFLTQEGEVIVNEIAPRVHNSGHYTMEACMTSQFEQHTRAITGMSLGKTDMLVPAAVMINILGERNAKADVSGLEKALALSNTFIHIYGKAETRFERKMGHITVVGKSIKEAYNRAKKARKLISI